MTSYSRPTTQQLDEVVAFLAHPRKAQYFFERLENPLWIPGLCKAGCFRDPPEPVHDDEQGGEIHPPWLQGEYLVRMAQKAPEDVIRVLCALPVTKNHFVESCVLDAALALPAEFAVRLLVRLESALTCLTGGWHADKLGQLVEHLASNGQLKHAFKLARKLLAIGPDPTDVKGLSEIDRLRFRPQPQMLFSEHDYGDLLQKCVMVLGQKDWKQTRSILCSLLTSATRHSQRGELHGGPEDYSWIWRPAIEDHEQNWGYGGLQECLVTALRDHIERVVTETPAEAPRIVEWLEKGKFYVFHRMALHVLERFPDATGDMGAQRLTNRSIFDNDGLRHEYVRLLRSRFAALSDNQKAIILGWIQAGPDLDNYRAYERREYGRESTPEQERRWVGAWQRDRLAPIVDVIDEHTKALYHSIVRELGEPTLHEFSAVHGPFGPRAPGLTVEQLCGMDTAEIAERLKGSQPTGDNVFSERGDLEFKLREAITQAPDHFVDRLEGFASVHPTYIAAIFGGLFAAVRAGKAVRWAPVLDFANTEVIGAIEGETSDSLGGDARSRWANATREIAMLLDAGLASDKSGLTFEHRETVWAILSSIAESSLKGDTVIGLDDDPLTRSINEAHGLAMHAIVRYALWVDRHESEAATGTKAGHRLAPEVRAILDLHLDPHHDSLLSTRAVYGQWLASLGFLDLSWLKANKERIFCHERPELHRAAWETFLKYSRPYKELYPILQDEYRLAISELDAATDEKMNSLDARVRLVQHLMSLYWSGCIEIDSSDGLIALFYGKGHRALEAQAMVFFGDGLRMSKRVTTEDIERLEAFGDWRCRENESRGPEACNAQEMASFGEWFISGKMPEDWSLKQLQKALALAGKVDLEFAVFDRLAEIAKTRPMDALVCLELAVKGDRKGWEFFHFRTEAKEILSLCIDSEIQEIRDKAKQLIDVIGQRGHFEFRSLLA